MSTVEIKLDDDLLALIDEHAAASGKARDESSPRPFRLREILDAARERSDLSEQEAMQLAIAEQKAYRAERDAG